MSTESFRSKKVPEHLSTNRVNASELLHGTYMGIVKVNTDATRSGRLKVWIPEFGAKDSEDKPEHWITVRYANPYMGATRQSQVTHKRSAENQFNAVNHTYGMWFTPPDIGNYVLITFVGGKPNNGYWFACVIPEIGHYAIPGQAGADEVVVPSEYAEALTNPPYPVVEFNEENTDLKQQWDNFLSIKKPIHETQAKVLLRQGLEDDKTRGVISSTSQRESPSRVFGISTPGRPAPVLDPMGQPKYRLGGHTFVMDDGAEDGVSQLVRLRTAGGHQIMLNDSDEVVYIGNSAGSVWLEFSNETVNGVDAGRINIYSSSDFNLRSQGNINLHSDSSINMYAASDIKMFAKGNMSQETPGTMSLRADTKLNEYGLEVGISSGSTLGLQAATVASIGSGTEIVLASGMIYLNTKGALEIKKPDKLKQYKWKDTGKTMDAPLYKWKFGKIKSGSAVKDYGVSTTVPSPIPTHEPYGYEHAVAATAATNQASGSTSTTPITDTPTTADSAGSANAMGKGVSKPASSSDLAAQPPNTTGVGTLTADETTALKAQIGKSESGGDYSAENQLGYIGKYQFGALALIDQGYVKSGTTNKGLSNPSNWTGKGGLTCKQDFWAAKDLQEQIMDTNMASNYKALVKSGTLNSSSPNYDVAGKLSVSHLLGAGGCKKWAAGGGGADANGTTGDTYYNRGRYAVLVLAKNKSAESDSA